MEKVTRLEDQNRPPKATLTAEQPSKIARILAHLVSGASLNRFNAEPLGDHCLHSTIAVLANQHGLKLIRQPERVPNRWGAPCRVIRYSLPMSERERALIVLARLHPTRTIGET